MTTASENKLINAIMKTKADEYGVLTPALIAVMSDCPEDIAMLGLVGDEDTLQRFLERRGQKRLRRPVSYSAKYDVQGDFVDVGAYMSGEPECMVSYEGEEEVRAMTIDIYLGRPHTTKDEQVFDYYTNVLDLVDMLESQGVRCQIYAHLHCYHAKRRRRTHLSIKLKEYSDPLNMAQFAGIVLNNRYFTKALTNINQADKDLIWGARCLDLYAKGLEQRTDHIQLPSMYFRSNSKRFDFPFDVFLHECNLAHLLD